MKKNRLDTLLVEQGYFADADEALRAVLAHEVKVNDVYATSAAVRVAPDAEVVVKNRKRFVSRGGHKLQGALDAFGQDVRGLRCLDIGSSTGGFSDCLLQAGAASVACVDVNYGQLAWKLRQDPRVSVFERVNIKLADPVELGAPFDVLVADLSFIGLAALAPVFARRAFYPSDQWGFPKALAVATLKRRRFFGAVIDRIHTRRDTILKEENIETIVEGLLRLTDHENA